MAWWGGATTGPRNRREMRAAYALLAEDTVELSGELGRARLESIRLGAMVDSLAQELGRVRAELTQARSDVAAMAQESAVMRPLVLDLMSEGRELRTQLAANQRTITELTARLTDLLEVHLEAARAAAPADHTAASAPRAPVADLRAAEQPVAAGAASEGGAETLRLLRRALG